MLMTLSFCRTSLYLFKPCFFDWKLNFLLQFVARAWEKRRSVLMSFGRYLWMNFLHQFFFFILFLCPEIKRFCKNHNSSNFQKNQLNNPKKNGMEIMSRYTTRYSS